MAQPVNAVAIRSQTMQALFNAVGDTDSAALNRPQLANNKCDPGRKWGLIKFPKEDDSFTQYDMLQFCSIITEEEMRISHFWSIVAWFAKADFVSLKNAALADGYTLELVDYYPVNGHKWIEDNFSTVPPPIAVHTICCLYTALLGKIISNLNIKYVQTRIERMRGIVNEKQMQAEWACVGHCPTNFIKATEFMSATPHIRAVLFNSFREGPCKSTFLTNLSTHVCKLLDGSFMTSQSMIIMEIYRRAEVVALFTELRVELDRFNKWLNGLTANDKKELGYIRLKYGEDKTQSVSLREMPLCSYIAFGLARQESSSLDNYSAFDRLDEKKRLIGDRIIKWILELERGTNNQIKYAMEIGFSKEKIEAMNNELKQKVESQVNFGPGVSSADL